MATDRPSPLPPPFAAAFTVFVDSSLGTHLAMPVFPGDTVADFKRKIAIDHALCFPAMGEVSVQALKVKRRGAFYHLSDTMLVMRAFDGHKGTWFLHFDVTDTSISKHQGGAAGQFVDDSREHPDDGYHLLLKPRLNLEEDLQLNRNNISIDDGSNLHEKADHIGSSKRATPGSRQVESLIDASIGQLAAGDHNADEPMSKPIEEHTEVFNNGGSLGDKEASNLETVPGEVHLATDMDTLLDPEECSSKLPAGDSILKEHLTDDKKKKKKKKGSRSSKSQQTEVDSAMLLNDHRIILSPTSDEQNIECGRPLEKNDVLGYVPAVMEGNNEALVNNQKDLIKKIDLGTKQTSENIAVEDSAGFDNTKKNVVPGFKSENMLRCSYSNHLSGTNNPRKAVEAGTSEVALNCDPSAVIIGPNVAPITKEAFPLAEVSSQIPTNFHSKKRSSKRLSKNALGSNDLTHSTEFANEENLKEILGSDKKDTNKESDTRTTSKEAPSYRDIAKVDTEDPSADDVRRPCHKKRRKSEKAASAEFQPNNHEPVQSLQNLTDKENLHEKLDDQKQKESVVTTEVDVLANSAAQDSAFPPKPDHARTNKEASIHEDIAILDTENPSAEDVGRSHHRRRRKSEKAASAESQLSTDEPVQSLQNLTDIENHEEKLVDQKQQELVVTTEVDVFDPSTDDVGRSRHRRRRKSEKAAAAESQPNSHEPIQSLQNLTNKENLEKKLDDQKQQELVVATEVDVLANSAAQDWVFPPKPDETRTKKETPSEDIAKLDTENPSADDVGKSHHKRRRKSEKAALAESQPTSHEPLQSLQNLTDKENLQEKLDDQKQELDVTTEVDVLANNAAHDSVFSPKPDETMTHKDAPSHEDIAKWDSENPSADYVGRSHHKKKKKSSKAGSANFQLNNHEEAGSTEFQPNNPEEDVSAEFQPNYHEPVQRLQNLASKQNRQEKLNEQKQQELVGSVEAEVFANHEALDSGFPPKLDAKSRRKKKKSSKIEVEVCETTQQDFAHSLVTEIAEARAKETIDDHHNDQSRQSELLANHGEATIGSSAKVNLVFSSDTNDKGRHHRKRKSAKSDLSYNTQANHDLIYSSEGQTKENFEKESTATDDPVGASGDDAFPKEHEQGAFLENDSNKHSAGLIDNLSNKYEPNPAILSNHGGLKGTSHSTSKNPGKELPAIMVHKGTAESAEPNKSRAHPNVDDKKINFNDAFCPTAVQHESVVSGHELPSTEPEPKKQHKSKRKRKLSKDDTTHDLVDQPESDKQNVTISEHQTNDSGNQDSVDRIVKPSSRGFNNTKAHYSVNDGGNLSDWMSPQNSHDISHSRVKEKVRGNKPDTSNQLSVSQDEQCKHAYYSNEKTATKSSEHRDADSPNYVQDEIVRVKKNETANVKAHAILSKCKATGDDSHHESLPNPAASSDSTQENTPAQANKYKLAVRKVPNKSLGKKSDRYQPKIPFVTSGAIFDDATTGESSEGELTAPLDSPSSLSDSDEDLENMQIIGSRKSAELGIDGDDIILSQSSMSRKGMPLGTILRSTSSYKKAKVLASQSQAEDSESQPVDVVLETQPETD